jgi:hypothetical protein
MPPRLPRLDPVQDWPCAENCAEHEREQERERDPQAFAFALAETQFLRCEHDVGGFGHG